MTDGRGDGISTALISYQGGKKEFGDKHVGEESYFLICKIIDCMSLMIFDIEDCRNSSLI